ncbi:MAG: helix-turn-helix domain-containing protein [Thermoplasmatales archaeon]
MIFELRESGKSIREISQIVGIKRSTVHGILKSVSEKELFVGQLKRVSEKY